MSESSKKDKQEEVAAVLKKEDKPMMKCKAYLEYEWKGGIADGEAVYSVLLEFIRKNGEPVTRQFIGSLEHMTKNRAVLKLAILALEQLKPCEIELHSNSQYLNIERFYEQRKKQYKGIKNADLIEDLLERGKEFKMTSVFEKENTYSGAMQIQRREFYTKQEKERKDGK